MPFKKKEKAKYPPRLWALVGFPGSGKSTFATQMRGPLLPIDADWRFDEVLPLVESDVYELSERAADHTDPLRISKLLEENMPGSTVGTIIVDSLTAIISPLVTKAMLERDQVTNKVAGFASKALAMRMLQGSIGLWGCDVLWIYHLQAGRDNNANKVVTATIPKTERARLLRSLNLTMKVVQEDTRRGIQVSWARRGRVYPEVPVLWDTSGRWVGMPEKIEAAVYDGLSQHDLDRIEQEPPTTFVDDAAAINWGLEQGVFTVLQHARNAYEKLQRESGAKGEDLAALWIADVETRQAQALALDEDSSAEPLAATDVEMSPDEPAVDASVFWTDFYRLKSQGKLPQADKLKGAPEVLDAKEDDNWGAALKWLHAQVRW